MSQWLNDWTSNTEWLDESQSSYVEATLTCPWLIVWRPNNLMHNKAQAGCVYLRTTTRELKHLQLALDQQTSDHLSPVARRPGASRCDRSVWLMEWWNNNGGHHNPTAISDLTITITISWPECDIRHAVLWRPAETPSVTAVPGQSGGGQLSTGLPHGLGRGNTGPLPGCGNEQEELEDDYQPVNEDTASKTPPGRSATTSE